MCSVCLGQSGNMSRQMGDSHRRFLQTMMGSGIIDQQGAKTLYQYCCETHNSESSYITVTDVDSRVTQEFTSVAADRLHTAG